MLKLIYNIDSGFYDRADISPKESDRVSFNFSELPAWEPGDQDVICAKFVYYYQISCFNKYVQELQAKIRPLVGPRRLQGNKGLLYFSVTTTLCTYLHRYNRMVQ